MTNAVSIKSPTKSYEIHTTVELSTLTNFVRGYIRISFPMFNIRSLKIVISIVVYLNMYNLL